MYDFLLQEEWWMETIIAASITAGVTLLISFLTYVGEIKGIKERLDRLLGEKHDKLSGEHGKLSGEHGKLSGEHGKLSDEHDKLSDEHGKLSDEHGRLKDEINRVILYQEGEKAARETMARNLPNEKGLMDMVSMVYGNHEKLLTQIMQLTEKVATLQIENKNLQQRLQRMEISREKEDFTIDDDAYITEEAEEDEWER
ncbi:MAG: hypothetical protein NC300_05780 [Bacteroidales bacterium]|nr:hypothetical protein [Clostridium sp.]MCM1203632.1 hypothetical protein [Bacteroidales bacterium]